ncbi:MAG: hypothetical protein IPP73_13025 [Chitinophagaceae bacterium]|nr:hypothetical protein [Chitinophagaceae bacterium]
MKIEKVAYKDLYFTVDHEWIDFLGKEARVGISPFKLTGFKEIHNLYLPEILGFFKRGDILVTMTYLDYRVEVQMPVDGKLLEINEKLREGSKRILLEQNSAYVWIARIKPLFSRERKHLILPADYPFLLNKKNITL